ncbi:MAG: non-canonical purine NTP pyrophosphatase, partial [Steroidobacteraceae bacterium]
MQALLTPLGFELMLQSELGIESAAETGASFEANALLKAHHAAGLGALPALADDSGLEVDALGGRPGVSSARYAGPAASDADNTALLLSELA